MEELRILDYGQRLTTHKRNSFYSNSEGDSGRFALDMITKSGRKAMHNFNENYFAAGMHFNAALIDANAPLIAASGLESLTSTIVYSTDVSMQCGVISKGKLFSEKNNESQIQKIKADFVSTLKSLANRS